MIGLRPRIILATGIYPPDVGGPANYVALLANTLQRDGYDVLVIVPRKTEIYATDSAGFSVWGAPPRLPLLRTLFQAVQYQTPNVIYALGIYDYATVVSRLTSVPLVGKVVGDPVWEFAYQRGLAPDRLETFDANPRWIRFWRPLTKRQGFVRYANTIVVASEFLAKRVRKWTTHPEKVRVIPNPVALPRPHPIRRRHRTSREPLRLLTGGRLLSWKRFDLAIRLVAATQGTVLGIIGEGPQRAHLRQLSRHLGVEHRIHFIEPVLPNGMAEVYNSYDVFVLPSLSETFSFMTIEAMAWGLPAVVAESGALPEVVGRHGILCDPTNLTDWIAALHKLRIDSDYYEDVSTRGQEWVHGKYDWNAIYPATRRILCHALEGITSV